MQHRRWLWRGVAAAALLLSLASRGAAQGGENARQVAPLDLTGYWVTIITPDWRQRMIPPAKGDYLGVPITAAAKEVADRWDPARDEATGQQCKSYGAPAIMAAPTRLRITWQDDNTLKVETDYGLQTRLLRFDGRSAPAGSPTWQGHSLAGWEFAGRGAGAGRGTQPPAQGRRYGSLKVTTTRVRPGYFRKNGIPYSADVRLVEYWDMITDPAGGQRLMVTQQVDDPQYLYRTWIATYNFKKEPDGSKWDPTPCSARW